MPSLAVLSTNKPADIARLASRGPRYTSYPPAPFFAPGFQAASAKGQLQAERAQAEQLGISLYAHIPFCSSLCWYCGCNVKITRDRSKGAAYVESLLKEARLYRELLGEVTLAELSLGGGSPNFLDTDTLRALTEGLCEIFPRRAESILGTELDPRDTTDDQIELLAALGYRRLSVGVQDFDQDVQATINRHQSPEQTRELIATARAAGFTSVGVDLVYGLPGQSPASFSETLGEIIRMVPDRIALFGYAHFPDVRKHQRLVEHKPIPDLGARATLLCSAIELLTGADYERVGFDHFARANDPLARAVKEQTLHRNFQGFTIARGGPLIACGVTGISDSGRAYWQNHTEISEWQQDIDNGVLPIARGIALTQDDVIRRSVIYRLMCTGSLVFAELGAEHSIEFASYFATELEMLRAKDMSELVCVDDASVRLTELGTELVRNVCLVFDLYLRGKKPSGSTTI